MNIVYEYLSSIAYMQFAVSKLLEAQAKRLRILADENFLIDKTTENNESIKKQLKQLENLHLLLSNKFKQMIKTLKIQDIYEDTETESGIMLKDHLVQLDSPYTEKPAAYILKGKGQGTVSNQKDLYANGLAAFQAYVSDANDKKKELLLSYSVTIGTKMLVLLASPEKMKTRFFADSEYTAVSVEGTGIILLKERFKVDSIEEGTYLFNLQTDHGGGYNAQTTFEINIQSIPQKQVLHESGQVDTHASVMVISL